jgi:choloylglycine hydrolase
MIAGGPDYRPDKRGSLTMNWRSTAGCALASALASLALGLASAPAGACTSLIFKAQDGTNIYARTMEWGASDLKSELVLVPRQTAFKSALGDGKVGAQWKNRFGFVGVNAGGLPYATDGMNEAGLTVGVLFFPGFAEFQAPSAQAQATTISSVDVANYLLGNFATVAEARAAMPGLRVVRNAEIEKAFGTPIPIHFLVTDASGDSIVIEYVKGVLSIFDNKVGVMTNSPAYDWHLLNLRNYSNLSPQGAPARSIDGVSLAPFGAGSGMLGLPGDFTPPSRFIRAVAFVHTMSPVKDAAEGVSAASVMLNNFDIPRGLVREGASAEDIHLGYTQWSVIADTRHKVYYYWTMYDRRMRSVDLGKLDFAASKPSSFPLDRVRTEDVEDRSGDFTH